MSTPTLRGTTAAGVGITYIPVDRFQSYLTAQLVANGTVTYTVDGTGDNILWNTATLAAANLQNRHGAVDASNATWDNLQASGSASGDFTAEGRYRCLRINITAGTGSVTFIINQGGGA